MRPIRLTMQAFGPFLNKVEISFDKLGVANTYLICGVTGSGKTTIFDAICFALFNTSSGQNRGNNTLRSHFASDSIESFVEFEFEFNNENYKIIRHPSYERKKARGEGYILEQSKALLFFPNGKILEKVKEVDLAIEELLGVNVSQFSQIAMLAQGEFLKLLNSDTQHRGEIFRNIFKTWKFANFQQKLKDNANELKQGYDDLGKSIFQDFSNVVLDDNNLKYKIESILSNKVLVDLDNVLELLKNCNDTDNKLLLQYKKEIEKIELQVANRQLQLQKIKTKNDLLLKKQETLKALDKVKAEFEVVEKEYSNLDNYKNDMQNCLIKANGAREQYQKALELIDLNNKKEEYLRQIKKNENEFKNLDRQFLQYKFNKYFLSNNDLKASQNYLLNLQQKYSKLSFEYNQNYNLYLSSQAGILAQNLTNGVACPVCGALEHPNPAKLENTDLTDEKLKIQKNELEILSKESLDISKKCAILNEQNIALKNDFEKCAQKFNIETLEFDNSLKENDFENIHEKLLQENKQLSLDLQMLVGQINGLSSGLKDLDIDEIKNLHAELESKLNNLKDKISNIETNYNAKNLELNNLSTNLKFLTQQILDISIDNDNIQVLEDEICEFKNVLEKYDFDIQKIISRKSINENAYNSIFIKNKEYEKISKKYCDYKILSECANGNLKGKQRIAFEQYIQGYYLDLVLFEANKHLKIMSQNQFQLLRKKDSFSNNTKSGLELEVMDFHTFKKRSTKTLSGGESFKASLSLALGLSDCISNISGALNFGAMFIDEGFGTLDSESLELAIDVIYNLSNNNRLIGIISHVDELKNKIQNQIIINKTQNGSDVLINFQ